VWHVHLSWDTENYRNETTKIYGSLLTHMPTLGGSSEDSKWDNIYSNTLSYYKSLFNQTDPPSDIWESEQDRFGEFLIFHAHLNLAHLAQMSLIRQSTCSQHQLEPTLLDGDR
jgi:hypothetical protein